MPHLSPQTLTRAEQEALLQASADHPRDHLLFSVALGTGMRLGEITGLNIGDVYFPTGNPRQRVRLRAEITKGGRVGDVFLPDALVVKMREFWAWKRERLQSLDASAPLFCTVAGTRISKRRVQIIFKNWQRAAGFDRSYNFHCLRHSAVTAVYRASRDLFLAQRFARHVSPLTTVVYTHASDEDLLNGVRGLAC